MWNRDFFKAAFFPFSKSKRDFCRTYEILFGLFVGVYVCSKPRFFFYFAHSCVAEEKTISRVLQKYLPQNIDINSY